MTSLVGDYVLTKADWYTVTEPGQGVDNLGRWKLAHAGNPIGTRSYNFQLTTPSTFVPSGDDSYQIGAHGIGVSGSRAVTGGYDFLWKGNYVSPVYQVVDIDGIPIPNGRLYYAGDTTNFDTPALTPPTRSPPIVRDWAEVTSTADLDTLIPLVDTNSYTLNVQNVSSSSFGITRYAMGTAAADNNTTVTTPVFGGVINDVIMINVGYIQSNTTAIPTVTWNGNAVTAGTVITRSLGGTVTLVGYNYPYIVSTGGTSGVTVSWGSLVTSYGITVVVIEGLTLNTNNGTNVDGDTTDMISSFSNTSSPPQYLHAFCAVAKTYSESHGTFTGDATNEGQSDGTTNIWVAEQYGFSNLSPASWTYRRNAVPTPTNWVYMPLTWE